MLLVINFKGQCVTSNKLPIISQKNVINILGATKTNIIIYNLMIRFLISLEIVQIILPVLIFLKILKLTTASYDYLLSTIHIANTCKYV